MGESFILPPLFIVLCAALGAAFFFSPHIFLFQRRRAPSTSVSLRQVVANNGLAVFFVITALSFLHGVFVGGELLWFELSLLCFMCLIGALYARQSAVTVFVLGRGAVKRFVLIAFLSILSVAGFFALLKMFILLNANTGLFFINPIRETVFVTGGAWIYALYRLYDPAGLGDEEGARFHTLLWPLLFGLLIIMAPLIVHKVVTSEEFQKSLHAPRPLPRI